MKMFQTDNESLSETRDNCSVDWSQVIAQFDTNLPSSDHSISLLSTKLDDFQGCTPSKICPFIGVERNCQLMDAKKAKAAKEDKQQIRNHAQRHESNHRGDSTKRKNV